MSEPSDKGLFLFTKEDYGDRFKADLVEQYKLYVQSAENVSARRIASNRHLLTINAAIVAIYGLQFENLIDSWLVFLVPVLGMLISVLWVQIIKSHKNLNTIKFEIIHQLEEKLPTAIYKYEWALADSGKGKRYRATTDIERYLPFIFLILHFIYLLFLAWRYLS